LGLMDVISRIRLLTGTVRPFIFGKVRDALRVRYATAVAKRSVPTEPQTSRVLRSNIAVLPSSSWMSIHGKRVLQFARRARDGEWNAYALPKWKVGDPDPSVPDVRCTHELSRMHHWCAYALAAHIDEERADEWCELLQDEIELFIKTYPPHFGVHWQFPMGVALRCFSMLTAWDWARQAGWTDSAVDARIAASAVDHALLTMARRETSGGMTTSHYLANMLGVMAAGAYVTGDSHTEDWYTAAVEALEEEMQRQFTEDGMNFEASTGYHRQSTDIMVQAAVLNLRFSKISPQTPKFSPQFKNLLRYAVKALQQIEAVGMPLIGDNDDGMAVKLTGLIPDTSYLFDQAENVLDSAEHHIAPFKHVALEDFGLDMLVNKHFQLTARCGPLGQYGKGGHAHNDQNSITLRVYGKSFIVDPGSTTYTGRPKQRNTDRSTLSHATVLVRGHEQNPWPKDLGEGLFWMLKDSARGEVITSNETEWVGQTQYFGHRREIKIIDSEIECVDSVNADQFVVIFPFDGDVVVSVGRNTARLNNDGVVLQLDWDNGSTAVLQTSQARRFANQVENTTLQLLVQGSMVRWSLKVLSRNSTVVI